MGEQLRRSASLAGDEGCGRVSCLRAIRPRWSLGGRLAVGLLSILLVLGSGTVPVVRAWAQDTQAKTEAPAKAEVPRESAPAQLPQEPAPAAAEALSLRYRFIEKYSPTEDPSRPELITQYRVGVRETQKTDREKPQGAPDRIQISRQTIYTERAAQVGKLGEMLDAVRRYDTFRMKPSASPRPTKTPPFEGLAIWYKRRPGQEPQILSLINGRALREFEYSEITKQVFLPSLPVLFPPTPRRVSDTWPISRQVAQYLVGELPDAEDYEMTGTLLEVRKTGAGTTLTAVIGVSGQLNVSLGKSMLNAQIHFVFEPAPVVAPPPSSGASPKPADSPTGRGRGQPEEGVVNARGWISRVLMAWTASNELPEDEGRLKQTGTYELNLERRLVVAPNEATGGQNATLTVPDPVPTPDEANSWLVYEDDLGRFHFRHPQELKLNPFGSIDNDYVDLVERHPKGDVRFGIHLQPKELDPARDRQSRDPDHHRRTLYSIWEKQHKDVVPGQTGWLPEPEWGSLKRKVYRIEAALKPKGQVPTKAERLYLDYYLVVFSNNQSIVVTAMTEQDSNLKLRNQAENIIRSFQFGPLEGSAKPHATPPEPSSTPPR
jgi:hypothetical protein